MSLSGTLKERVETRRGGATVEPVSAAGDMVPPGKHDRTREADPYAFAAAHRRLAWMFRVSAGMNIGFFALTITLVAAIAELVPAQKIDLALVRIDPVSDTTEKVDLIDRIRIEPITKDVPGYDLMLEAFARRYVRLLLEIDQVSQDDRMLEAAIYSDRDFWKTFAKERFEEIEKAMNSGLDRTITVETIDLVSRRDGISRYAVDLVQTDRRAGKVVEEKKVRAYLAVAARPQDVRPSERFENPAGFRVLEISLKQRENS